MQIRGPDREKNLDKDVYFEDSYFTYTQLWSFVEQIYHIREFRPQSMLEIGVGNGFVSMFCKVSGINVKTFDINPKLEPDMVASVYEIGKLIKPNEFDLISCCEVLEHLPFEDFEGIIKTFSSISSSLFLTLPAYGRKIGFGGVVELPRFYRWFGLWLKVPTRRGRLPDIHFWGVDFEHTTRRKAIAAILNIYYSEVKTGFFKANPYHCFFECREAKSNVAG
jgi:hypothetical protein